MISISNRRLVGRRSGFARAAGFLAAASALALGACGEVDGTVAAPAEIQPPVAFPGAQGHGRFAKGGRGGELMFVTTLRDSGPGSLRACIEAEGPRVCLFRVSGVIRFETERPIIENPFITIAGESAPGDGVVLAHVGGAVGLTPLVVKDTHDVVVRHIRIRPDRIADNRAANDAITLENAERVILDHVSASWALDENLGGAGATDEVTVSWSVFAEGLQDHDKCALIVSDVDGAQRFSFLNNICAHNGDRNPNVNVGAGSCVEVVNNVLYNAESEFIEIWESFGGSPVNVVGNYIKAGPNTSEAAPAIRRSVLESRGQARIYVADNYIDPNVMPYNEDFAAARVDEPVCPLTVRPAPAETAYDVVLRAAGALPRDAFDARIIDEIDNGIGDQVSAPGAMPRYEMEERPLDGDADGMADTWERLQGIDDTVFNPWEDVDGDGWANIEEYLDFLHRRRLYSAGR